MLHTRVKPVEESETGEHNARPATTIAATQGSVCRAQASVFPAEKSHCPFLPLPGRGRRQRGQTLDFHLDRVLGVYWVSAGGRDIRGVHSVETQVLFNNVTLYELLEASVNRHKSLLGGLTSKSGDEKPLGEEKTL